MQRLGQITTSRIAVVMLVIIVATSLILNVVSFRASISRALIGDAAFYFRTGQNMALGLGYTFDGRTPTFGYSIGYPIFIAAVALCFPDDVAAIYVTQIILSYVTFILFYLLMKRHFENVVLRLIPLLFFALNYKMIQSNCTMMSESFSLFVLVGFFYLVDSFFTNSKYIFLIIASAMFALLSLVRPVYMYFAFVFSFFMIVEGLRRKKKYLAGGIFFLVVVFLLLSPMLVRNKILFGGYKLAFNGGVALFQGTYMPYDGLWHDWSDSSHGMDELPQELRSRLNDECINGKDDILRNAGFRNIYLNGMRGVPLYAKNMSRLLFAFPFNKSFASLPLHQKLYVFLNALPVALLVCGLFYVAWNSGSYSTFAKFAYALFFCYVLFHAFIANTARYGFPALLISYMLVPFILVRIPACSWMHRSDDEVRVEP